MYISITATSVQWGGVHYYGKMHKMQHVEQLATLRLVEWKGKFFFFWNLKNDDTRRFLKLDITLVSEQGIYMTLGRENNKQIGC